MTIYFNAFVNTLFLMSIAGVAAASVTWIFLSLFHASHTVEVYGIGLAEIGVLIATAFVFHMLLGIERELADTPSNLEGLDKD